MALQVVGKMRSGKVLKSSDIFEEQKSYLRNLIDLASDDDLFDMFVIFEYLLLRAVRKDISSVQYKRSYDEMSKVLTADKLIEARGRIGLKSAFEHVGFARQLVVAEFRDF